MAINHPLLLAFFLSILVTAFAANELASGPHIADVNVLLPPRMTRPVEYRLQGVDGCFKWSWDHHDILSVIPEYNETNHCSTSARLRSIAPYSGRKETAVYAEDVLTGTVIRCKVFIDIFSRIQIFHSSIKLDLDGLATLRVRAFDGEDNVFSSLVGLQFMWKLRPESDGSSHHLLHVPIKDSPLSDCSGFCGDLDIQINLENSGVYSDLFVVRGIRIGRDVVSVHLLEPQVLPMEDKIHLTVAEAMSLDPPSPVLVLAGATVQYRLKVVYGNIPRAVTLPSPFHRWAVLNSSVAEVDPKMGLAHAVRLGKTSVVVEDTRVAGHVQMSSLHVVLPETLSLYMLPLSETGDPIEGIEVISSTAPWYVVVGRQYLIDAKVFSRGPAEAQEILITKSEELQLNYDQPKVWITFPASEGVSIKYGRSNSRILDATSSGLGKLSATLSYLSGDSETKQALTTVQGVMVCNKVEFRVDQQPIILPWAKGVHQELQLEAVGGCSQTAADYKWLSSDLAIVSVSATGVVQAKGPGKATIKAISAFDILNFDEVVIEVDIPYSLVMLPNFPVETVAGSHLLAALTMKTSNGDYFCKCDAFSSLIKWKTGSQSFVIVNSTKEAPVANKLKENDLHASISSPPCSWTYIYAVEPGRTVLQATMSKESHKFDLPYSGPAMLKASTPIASFMPLVVHQAAHGNQFGGYWVDLNELESPELTKLDELHLVPGTHMDIELMGGPNKWGEDVEFLEVVDVIDDKKRPSRKGAFAHQTPGVSGNLYRIVCQTLGSFQLIFKRGNLAGADHSLPVVAEVQLSLACAFPSSIVILADEPVNAIDVIKNAIEADRSSDSVRSMPVTVANGRTIRMSAVSLSSSGKAFANSSSLSVSWELDKCNALAFWDDANVMKVNESGWERFLVLKNASGLCIVHAMVHDFQPGSKNFLADTVHLQLVSTLSVSPDYSLLFFHPDAKINLSVTGGSCFLDAAVNHSQVVEVVQPTPGLCSQLTLAPKGFGTALVTVYDVGLSPPLTATSVVQVADVEWVKIMSGDEISIMEGGSESINIFAGINSGNSFEFSQYAYMSVAVHIEDCIIDIMDGDTLLSPGDGYLRASNFTIHGRHVGVTTLYVSVRQHSGLQILSQPVEVEVYAPPRVHPYDIFLVPGASYVLTLRGGPSFAVATEYTTMDDTTAKIDQSSGQLLAISPGNTTVIATIYGSEKMVICRAYGDVRVAVPSSMALNVQSKQLAVGRDTPIFPLLSEGNLFSFYELCSNYQWSVENEKVLTFEEARHMGGKHYMSSPAVQKDAMSANMEDQIDIDFIRLLYGRFAGITKVSLTFSCEFSSGSFSQSMSYESNVIIKVVSDPPLALGIPITWILPPHYTSSSLLPSSSDLYNQRDTQSPKNSVTYSILAQCSVKDEHHRSSISIDGSRIRTTDSNSLACIQAKDHTNGRVEVACCVRVAEVSQIRIGKVFASHVVDLAVGIEAELRIGYYDHLGNPFHEANNLILSDVDTNRADIVTVDSTRSGNRSIIIKTLQSGKALVRVRLDDDPHKSDYILVSVGAHIYPRNPFLYTGSVANFSIEGLKDQVSGQWVSANGSVVRVDSLSGQARAVGEGTTIVAYTSSNSTLQTTVTVMKANAIFVDSLGETLTNVPSPKGGYSFPVKFSNKFESSSGKVEVPFDCRLEPAYVGYAKPWRDLDTGRTHCLFFPYSPEHLAHALPPSKDMRQGISISIHASLREAPDVSGYATALFVGGFSILDMDKDLLQLNLTHVSNQSIITLVGNTDVGIHWRDHDLLLVSPMHRQESGISGFVQYEVKAKKNKPFVDKLIFTLPATGQRLEVDVIYEPRDKEPASSSITSFWAYFWTLAASFATLLFMLAFVIRRLDRSNAPHQPAAPTARGPAPATPERWSPAAEKEQSSSPRTPQPFIDYVRRTVDETPYYRRDLRGVNLQNTY